MNGWDSIVELNLTKTSYEHVRACFEIFCSVGVGSHSQETFDVYDVLRIFNLLGEEPTIDEIEDIFDEVDVQNIGFINFFTFVLWLVNSHVRRSKAHLGYEEHLIQLQTNYWNKKRELQTAFELFDSQNKGYITKDNIRSVFQVLGGNLTDAEVDCILKEGDLNGDGKIDYQEFQILMNNSEFIWTYDEEPDNEDEEPISIYSASCASARGPRTSFSVAVFEEITIVNLRKQTLYPNSFAWLDDSWDTAQKRSSRCSLANDHALEELDSIFLDAQTIKGGPDDSGSSISCAVSLFKSNSRRHSGMFEEESM